MGDDGSSGASQDDAEDPDTPEEPPTPDDEPGDPDGDDDSQPADDDAGPELPFDPDQLARVCERGNGDRVAQALCSGTPISGLTELREALHFNNPIFGLNGNSSSLVAHDVTPLNPRLVIADRLGNLADTLAMGFARGDQLVELVGFDPVAQELNFYLIKFEQACNANPDGCSTADLVTPAVEEDWTRWTVYQDTDLVNTTVDCAVCHQPLGPNSPKILRMQEVQNSWTHWFPTRPPPPDSHGGTGAWSSGGSTTSGIPPSDETHGTLSSEMWDTFKNMHEVDGVYGGVPLSEIEDEESGPDLETFVTSYTNQRGLPGQFSVPQQTGGSSSFGNAFFVDTALTEQRGRTEAWDAQFAQVVAGQRLPVPSWRINIADETAQQVAIASYVAVMNGEQPASSLQDPRAIINEEVLTEMSMLPVASASAEQILTHMCSRCHNGSLDQSLTRARFNANNLGNVDAAMKEAIAGRILRDHDDRRVMPPPRFGTLPQWAIDRVLAWTEQ